MSTTTEKRVCSSSSRDGHDQTAAQAVLQRVLEAIRPGQKNSKVNVGEAFEVLLEMWTVSSPHLLDCVGVPYTPRQSSMTKKQRAALENRLRSVAEVSTLVQDLNQGTRVGDTTAFR